MGHKFSDLKGALPTMEKESRSVKRTGTNADNTSEQSSVADKSTLGENENKQVVPFENIYSSTSALGIVSNHAEEASCSSKPSEQPSGAKNPVYRSSATKTLSIVCGKRLRSKSLQTPKEIEKTRKKRWVSRFNCALLRGSCGSNSVATSCCVSYIPDPSSIETCTCTGYRQTGEQQLGASAVFEVAVDASKATNQAEEASGSPSDCEASAKPVIDLSKFNPDDYPIDDCDEQARQGRAREIAEGVGVEAVSSFRPGQHFQLVCSADVDIDNLTLLVQTHLGLYHRAMTGLPPWDILPMITAPIVSPRVHTQIDYIHYLVPDLLEITSSSFYWGKMDRYEAERLLEGRPEGTFLLRDSVQEEYLFSVSFRRYGRSLHARIEEWNHKVSFDSHDPGVFAASTVCGLIEHYNDPSCCMFFEPVLTNPLHRDTPFSLQHLCRAVVSSRSTYDGINQLMLPKALKNYLKEYHYKQRVCVRRLDTDQ